MKIKNIKLEHGSGGALSRQLTEEIIYPILKNDSYRELSDATIIDYFVKSKKQLAFTTDTYTVDPPAFPGGDIGKLAIYGTCNDLAVSGAKPLFLSMGMVLEEGLSIEKLQSILLSIQEASTHAGIRIITGDTKVVPKGKGGEIYINTSGIGEVVFSHGISPSRIKPGDYIIISNSIGSHGIAVLSARESLSISSKIQSDVAFLYPLCEKLFTLQENLKFLRDATRGGISAVLNEIVSGNNFSIEIDEEEIPISDDILSISNILGLNPLEIANEGVFVAVVSKENKAKEAVNLLKDHPLGKNAAIVGRVTENYPGKVILNTNSGGKRILDFPRGLLLPRIC